METQLEAAAPNATDCCKRCDQCGEGAKIECLLCLKSGLRPVPCFCSKPCYEAHWTVHKHLKQRSQKLLRVPSLAPVYDYQQQQTPQQPQTHHHHHLPVECHSYEPVTPSVMHRHAFQPPGAVQCMWRHYLMTAPAHPTHRHE